jgi:hypothetical protein
VAAREGERTFVGYHGTSILWVPSLLRGVTHPRVGNFANRRQLGIGFYVTPDFPAATDFAEAAGRLAGGPPAVVYVYARDFDQLGGLGVPVAQWWTIADDSPFITDCDYLTAAIYGYPGVGQIKFKPRAYHALAIEVPG